MKGTIKPRRPMGAIPWATQRSGEVSYRTFFLCLFFRKRFLRLCVAILCLFLFLPHGMCFWC
jgi:hypothetical protein